MQRSYGDKGVVEWVLFLFVCAEAAVCTASVGVISLIAESYPPEPNEEINSIPGHNNSLLYD